MKGKFIQFRVTESFKERIREVAEYKNISISQLVVRLLERELVVFDALKDGKPDKKGGSWYDV